MRPVTSASISTGRSPLMTDDRTRVLVMLVLAATTVLLVKPMLLVMMLAVAMLLASGMRLWSVRMLLGWLAVNGVLLITAAALVLGYWLVPSSGGEPWWLAGGLFWLKANALLLLGWVLPGSLPVDRLAGALVRLGVPSAFAWLMSLTVRYVGVLDDERRRLWQAIRARGFTARGDWHSLQVIGWLCGMILLRGLDRSHRVAMAMRCRGFDPDRVSCASTRMGGVDYLCLMTVVGFSVMSLWIQWQWIGAS